MKGIIEAINAESLKSEVPAFEVGDTVKVGYRIMKAARKEFRTSKASLSQSVTAAFPKLSPYATFLTA